MLGDPKIALRQGQLSIWDWRYRQPQAVLQRRDGQKANPCPCGLAPNRGLPSQCLTTLLVRSYRTVAPLPLVAMTKPEGLPRKPVAVYFCGTLLTVTRTGHYPASLAFGEPGLSSGWVSRSRPARNCRADFSWVL
jgi:hypothetical protein